MYTIYWKNIMGPKISFRPQFLNFCAPVSNWNFVGQNIGLLCVKSVAKTVHMETPSWKNDQKCPFRAFAVRGVLVLLSTFAFPPFNISYMPIYCAVCVILV